MKSFEEKSRIQFIKTQIQVVDIKFVKQAGWKEIKIQGGYIYYTGSKKVIDKLMRIFCIKKFDENKIGKFLLNDNRNCSFIIKTKNILYAATSFCRDYPIFFRVNKKKLIISNNIRKLKKNNDTFNSKSLFEFATCGYSLGLRTLLNGIYSLGPANILTSYKNKIRICKYFTYHKTLKIDSRKKIKDYLYQLNKIIDDSLDFIIENSNDRTIYIPLSGGMDSRLIASKFHEKGFKNIKCFSYGLKNNSDALIAKKVADHLNLKWEYIWFNKDRYRQLFFSSFKDDYDKYSDHFSCIPNYGEIFFLKELKERGYFTKNPIIINGQSGDFNSGLHIPSTLYDFDKQGKNNNSSILESIKKKHFSLWLEKDLRSIKYDINTAIRDTLDLELRGSPLSDIYENWEYKERQCKYVVNGQRAYDFLNFDWFLPLWDSEFVKFWTTIPLELRYKQNLYRKYLGEWNYRDIFEGIDDKVTGFTGLSNLTVKTLSFFLSFIVSQKNKEKIISYSDYFSRHGFQYQFYGLKYFLNKRRKSKNAVGHHIRDWLKRNNLLDRVYLD